MHGGEDGVASRLQGQVQVVADRGVLRHRSDGLGPQILGMRAGEAHTLDALHRGHRCKQIGEQRTDPPCRVCGPLRSGDAFIGLGGVDLLTTIKGEIATVGVHVLSEQSDLVHTICSEAFDLGHKFTEGTREFASSHRRHDAVGAGVIAADLDAHPGRVIDLTPHGERRWERFRLLECFVPDLEHRARAA